MAIRALAAAFLLLSSYSPAECRAAAAVDPERVSARVAQGFVDVMGGCAGRVWPGYSWRNLDVLLVRRGAAEVPLVRVGGKAGLTVPAARVPAAAFSSSYFFFRLHGRAVMTLNVSEAAREARDEDDAVTQLFELGVHESFHRLGQAGWVTPPDARGTEIPVLAEPRFYRRMVFDRLLSSLESGGEAALANSAYWYARWREEFPSEARAATDGYEGTARYVEVAAELLRRHGCGVSEETLRERVVAYAKETLAPAVSGDSFSLDGEGYELGAVAAFALRFLGGHELWRERMGRGITPPAELLAGRQGEAEEPDRALFARFIARRDAEEARVRAQVGTFVERLRAADTVFVSLRGDWHRGSEDLLDTWLDRESHAALTAFGAGESLRSPKGHGTLGARAGAVFVELEAADPCGGSRVLAFAPTEVTGAGDRLEILSAGYAGHLTGATSAADGRGRRWWCID